MTKEKLEQIRLAYKMGEYGHAPDRLGAVVGELLAEVDRVTDMLVRERCERHADACTPLEKGI